jgi:hypothetical protein
MTPATNGHVPATYHLRVEGHLDQYWAAWFGDLTLIQESDGTTSITGVISDQAELHGLLIKIRDLGVTLVSVALVEPPTSVDPNSEPTMCPPDRSSSAGPDISAV